MKIAVVLPSIRETSLRQFVAAWDRQFDNCTVIIVEDNEEKTFKIENKAWLHFCHADIERDLLENAWIIPRKTDCVRSYGYLKAIEMGAEAVLTLDDDCYPAPGFAELVNGHVEQMETPAESNGWFSTCMNFRPRGYPYYATARTSRVVINHGLWEGVPDFDAPSQLLDSRMNFPRGWLTDVVPKGLYFPMCGMNVMFRAEVAPCFYFLLMGKEYPFDRFGDIWCGILAKKICDHLSLGVRTGPPAIHHSRASDVWRNLAKEVAGLEWNEKLWRRVDATVLTGANVSQCYKQLADTVATMGDPYFQKLARAMHIWAELAQHYAQGGARFAKHHHPSA